LAPHPDGGGGQPEHHRSTAEGREARRSDLQEPSRRLQPDGSPHRQRSIQTPRAVLFGGPQLGAVRIDDFKFTFFAQPWGWPGEKTTTDMPQMVNIRQDPFERTPSIRGESFNTGSPGYVNDFFAREFWRFVMVQQFVEKLALTAVDYPPMQD